MSRLLLALLGSGEFEPWTEEADRWLLERASGDGTVLILPTASAPEGDRVFDRWGNMGLDHFRSLDIPADIAPLKTRADASRPDLVQKAERASMVYLSGGNPAHLAATLLDTPFWETVTRRMPEGLAYTGCSAGIACLGEVAPDSTARDPLQANIWRPGLGLFKKTYFGPHWDALDVYVPGLRAAFLASVPDDCRLLAIDERTAVVGDGEDWNVVGKGTAHLLEEGEWSEFPSGIPFHWAVPTGEG
jgi:cyanophycinase-like exopeptidase